MKSFSPTHSSTVANVKYDENRKEMEVEFKSGHRYLVPDVSEADYTSFEKAPSHGTHYHTRIRNNFAIRKLA